MQTPVDDTDIFTEVSGTMQGPDKSSLCPYAKGSPRKGQTPYVGDRYPLGPLKR
jgi:hypothetical protein